MNVSYIILFVFYMVACISALNVIVYKALGDTRLTEKVLVILMISLVFCVTVIFIIAITSKVFGSLGV